MTELSPIVVALAQIISAIYGVLKGNIASLFNLLTPLVSLKSVDFSKLKADIASLQPADLATLDDQFKASLSIPDPAALAKMAASADALNQAVLIGESLVANVESVISLIAQIKAIFNPVMSGKMGATPPAFVSSLPVWLQWLWTPIINALTLIVEPLLLNALPGEASIIQAIFGFLA